MKRHMQGLAKRFVSLVLAGTLMTVAPLTALAQGSNPFAAAVTVNDTIITQYQVNQRSLFLTLLRAPSNDTASALKALTNETLQVQAARAGGVVVAPEALDAAMVEFAARANLEPEEFIKILEQNGVAGETFRDFVRNGVMWRDYVRQRFGPRAQISEAEIDRALTLQSGRGSARILLSEIILPLTPENTQSQTALASRLSNSIKGQGAFSAAARRYSAAPSKGRGGRLDWLPLSNLPGPVAGQVITLAPGEVSSPINMGQFIGIFMLRDLEEITSGSPETLAVEYAEVLIPGGRSAEALSTASQLQARLDTCDDLYGLAKNDGVTFTRESVQQADLPQDLSLEISKLDDNEFSTMLTSGANLRMIMLCGRSVELPEGAREEVRGQLRQQRLVTYANGHLDELRADAIIRTAQ